MFCTKELSEDEVKGCMIKGSICDQVIKMALVGEHFSVINPFLTGFQFKYNQSA